MALSQSLCQQGGVTTGTDTYTAANTGTASSDRVNAFITFPTNSPSAATINAIAAAFSTDTSLGLPATLVAALNASGSTGNVVLTGSGGFEIESGWAITGATAVVATSFGVQAGNASPTINVQAGGVVLGVCFDANGGATTPTFSAGLTNQGSGFSSLGAFPSHAGAANFATAQTVTCTITGAVTAASLLVAFAPAPQTLTPSLFTDADTFFSPTVTRGAVTLTPALFTEGDTFFSPTVTRGAVTLTPSLYTDADTFFGPTVSASNTLTPALFTDADTFFSPTVTPGAVTLTPSLYTDADTFYSPTVSLGSGDQTLTPSLFTDADTFFTPIFVTATYTLAPSLYTDADTFFGPTVTPGDVSLAPGLYTDPDTFFGPVVSPGAVTILPALYTDADAFFAPTLLATYGLLPSLYTDADTFFAPTVTPGAATLLPSLFTDPDQFFTPTVSNGGVVTVTDLHFLPFIVSPGQLTSR